MKRFILLSIAMIVVGLAPWVFSPLLFHNEMSELLILLMVANVLVGMLILPSYIAWRKPKFAISAEPASIAGAEPMAGSHGA